MNRRRLLEKISDIPYSEYLVFYAPLNTADSSDIFSGISPTTDASSTASFDTVKGMWRLRAGAANNSSLVYSGLDMGLTVGQEITMVIDVEEITMYDQWQSMFSTPKYNQGNNAYIRHDRYYNNTTPMSGRFCVTYTYRTPTGQYADFYKDGVFFKQVSWGNPNISANIVTICETANSSGRYYEIYASNARIYNKAFTAAEIANL